MVLPFGGESKEIVIAVVAVDFVVGGVAAVPLVDLAEIAVAALVSTFAMTRVADDDGAVADRRTDSTSFARFGRHSV